MPNKKKRTLTSLKLAEVSLVNRPAMEPALALLQKSMEKAVFPRTREAKGHSHVITLGGADGFLTLRLRPYEDDSTGASHTHDVVQTVSGYQVSMVEEHSHTLPDLRRVVEAMLLATSTDPEPEPGPGNVGKADTSGHSVVAHTSVTQAHQHSVIRRQNGTYALSLAGDPSHTHEITLDGDFLRVAMAEGHVHDVKDPMSTLVNKSADNESKVLATLLLDNLASFEKKTKDSNMNDIEKRKIAKAQAEQNLDALAQRIAKALNLTSEQGMDRALQTAKGQELYKAMVTPISKAAPADPLADWCAEQVEAKLAKNVNEYDTVQEVAEKRRQFDREVMDSPEYATKYAEIYQPRLPAEPDNPDPLSLRKSGETFQKCVDRLTDERAFHRGVTKAAAYASMARDETLLPLLEKAYAESIQASDAVMRRMTNG